MTFSEPNPDVRPVGDDPAEFIDPPETGPPADGRDRDDPAPADADGA